MAFDPGYTVKIIADLSSKSADIEFWDGAVFISKWTYDSIANLVHATAKADTYDVDFEVANTARAQNKVWIDFINDNFRPNYFPRSNWQHEIKRTTTKVESMIKIGGVLINDDEWRQSNNMLTYGPRPEIHWAWADYMLWRKLRDEFHEAIKNFGRTG